MSKKKRKKKKATASQAPAATAEASAAGREKLEQKLEKLEQKLEDKKREAFASTPDVDDTSIPPVVEDEFFKKGDEPPRVSAGMSGSFDAVVPDARSQRKLSPEARARRAHLSKWVKAAVAASAAILAIGALRVTLTRHKEEPAAPRAAAALAAPVEVKVDPPAAPPAPPPAAEPPKDEAKAEAAKDQPADSKDTAAAKDEPRDQPAEKPAKTAAQEKASAQALLDANNAGGAAAAAQRSVALDPHDAEAWLILGAAYQMQGSNAAAKQAFASCTKQAKRGPVSECSSMLSQ